MTQFTYTNNVPNPPNRPAADVPSMQTNTNSIASIIAVDHIGFNSDGAGTSSGGYHTVIHQGVQSGNPAAIPNIGQTYVRTVSGDQQLFYESGLGVVTQITGPNAPSATANGYTWLPGGVLLQWGAINGAPIANAAVVTYSIPFPTAVFSVTLGPTSSSTTDKTINITTGSVSTTQFTVITSGTSSFQRLYWMAVGN